ncbi:hypothetical protein MC885_010200 [Smutsia gigantea]|nr:hypothetical protein MC885_010200 [Smutsia gigantea]
MQARPARPLAALSTTSQCTGPNAGACCRRSQPHTHLLILAMVVSATKTKSSAGESCTPLGKRNWSSNTFTSLVSVSYSSRLRAPPKKGRRAAPRGPSGP